MASQDQVHCCGFCPFKSREKKEILKHVKQSHSSEPGFQVNCKRCGRSFKVLSSFTSHVSRFHPGITADLVYDVSSAGNTSCSPQTQVQSEDVPAGSSSYSDDAYDMDGVHNFENELHVDQVERPISFAAANFIIGLKEKYLVTQTCVDYAVEGASNLVDHVLNTCRSRLNQRLHEAGISPSSISLDDVFDGEHCTPFTGLSTAYQQTQFIKNNLPYVEPLEITLGSRWVTGSSGERTGQLVLKEDKMVYVPIIETLQVLTQNKSILEELTKEHTSSDELLRDICDGWQSKEHNSIEDIVFNILMYYDDIEVCNPLGSHTKVHKLGVFYFTLANFKPVHRSKLTSIYLVAVAKSSVISEYGYNRLLTPFISDMQRLVKGLKFIVNHNVINVKGSVLLFLADTLAAHQLGGYKVGVGFSFRKCRNCLATDDDIDKKFYHHQFHIRTPDLHDYQCSQLLGALGEFYSTTYGINYQSKLNEIPLFNVADWQLPQDVMHVLLEGVLPLEIKLLLHQFTTVDKFVTVAHINTRIKSFNYGYSSATSKPGTIDTSHLQYDSRIHQNASQSWVLGRFLPLLIGDLVPPGNQHWECFLYLHDILLICMSPCISDASVSYLSELINIHHQLFKHCYPTVQITPKLHYMVHFPEQIRRFGPLVRYWCMRMEAKNFYTKKAATCGNFKNVCLSFASRHQRLLAFNLTDPNIMTINIETGPSPTSIPFNLASPDIISNIQEIIHVDLNVHQESTILHRPKWIKLGNMEYRKGAVVLLGFDGVIPIFGEIQEFFYINNKPLINVSQYLTVGHDEHCRSYIVKEEETPNPHMILLPLTDLIDYCILHVHQSFSQTNNSKYICLKWNIECKNNH